MQQAESNSAVCGDAPHLFQSGAKTRLLNRRTTRFSMSSFPEEPRDGFSRGQGGIDLLSMCAHHTNSSERHIPNRQVCGGSELQAAEYSVTCIEWIRAGRRGTRTEVVIDAVNLLLRERL